MNILINLASSEKDTKNPYHGGNEYCNVVSNNLILRNINKYKLIFYCNKKETIDSKLLQIILDDEYSELVEGFNSYSIPDIIKQYRIQRIFDPMGVKLAQLSSRFNNIDFYYVIHGLRPIEMPTDLNEYFLGNKISFLLKSIFKKTFLKRKHDFYKRIVNLNSTNNNLIVVSEHTKYSISAEFSLKPDDIRVFYSPEKLNPNILKLDEDFFFKSEKRIVPNNYFLFLSAKRWQKNSFRTIKALDELIDTNQLKNKVVILGANEKVNKLIKNREHFIILDYVNEKDLEVLYKNAFCLLYTSLNEGFGYPPLEAMKYGTPVINSNISAIPEIIESSGLGFSPFSTLELKARIIQLQNDKNIYKALINKGLNRYLEVKSRQEADLADLCDYILTTN
jgi:glycosyltransferase involved in cell wall biosynthesis